MPASNSTSFTVDAAGPCVENSIHRGRKLRPTAPIVGFRPTSPVAAAGPRTLPPPSDVVASGARPAASAADEPPLEPPGDRDVFHGFRVAPKSLFEVNAVPPNSGLFVRPMMIAPSARSRATAMSSSVSGAASLYSNEPAVVTWPFTRAISFTRSGSPASAPCREWVCAIARASSA